MNKNIKHPRLRDSRSLLRTVECFLEILILTLLYYYIWRNLYPKGLFHKFYFRGKYVLMGLYAVLLGFFLFNADAFSFGQRKRTDLILGQATALLLVNAVTYFQLCLIANAMVSPIPIVVLLIISFVIAVALVFFYSSLHHKLFAPRKMVMVYGTDNAVALKFKMDTRQDKYNITKLLPIKLGYDVICREILQYDAVVINDIDPHVRNDLLKYCYENSLRVYLVPKISDVIMRGAKDVTLFDTPLVRIIGTGPSLVQRIAKRTMDLVIAGIAFPILLPFMAIIALAIKLEDGGPVLYKQRRLTIHDREFNILKFRSMIPDAEKYTGAVLSTENDPRITKVGKCIRATRLDELPQIFNILKGDMSVVGPRPERKSLAEKFCEEMPEFAYRTRVKGGLTGYAQVYGKYNTSPYDKLRFDLMYIENYSLLLDLKLIILTVQILFIKESTEGIDVAQETAKKKDKLLQQLKEQSDLTEIK